ncbi:hypothetical protein JCM24511_07431 [Saitozyma sp. JCM 24511]|nr:hypothetical protein JCM24511_07431 [Saitozyma sp. JCM 24511]
MAPVALITTALKAFTAFWSLVTMAVAGAFINKVNDILGMLHGPGNGRRAVKARREEQLHVWHRGVVGDSGVARDAKDERRRNA